MTLCSAIAKSWRLSVLVLVMGILVFGACRRESSVAVVANPEEEAAQNEFRDVTGQSGVEFTYHNGQEADHYAILESLGGGVALLDYDGDGLLDVFVTGGGYFGGPKKEEIKGHACRLYKNLGNWQFRDVTHEVGLDTLRGEQPWFYNHGAAVADYDNDGWPDLLVTGYGRLALFHNDPAPGGGRRFVDVTKQAGLDRDRSWSTGAAWADLDGDGFPDLYVCHYVDWSFENNPRCEGYSRNVERDVCPPKQFDALPHKLYRNNGNGTFSDVSKEAGLRGPREPKDYRLLSFLSPEAVDSLRRSDRERDYGKGLGVVAVDIDDDGKPDLYVTNDTTDKFLYINRSTPGKLRLEEKGQLLGVAQDDRGLPNGSMGVDAGDFDGCGRPSLLVTNFENEFHGLYRNTRTNGQQFFQFASTASGIASIGRQYVGFGTGFIDVDNDGWLDIFIANGHVIRHPVHTSVRQRPVLLRNLGRQSGADQVRFADVSGAAGEYFKADHQGRGVAVGDLDNDGRPDLVISHLNDPVTLLSNQASTQSHWLGVALSRQDKRDFVGARVTLHGEGKTLTRFAKGGGSYLSSSDRRLIFGLGQAQKVEQVTVDWPGGQRDSWTGLEVDCYWRLSAGQKIAERLGSR